MVLTEVEGNEEVGGSCERAPNPPIVSGLLEGGRTLVTQGLTTPQEPTRGEEEERTEESLKISMEEISARFKEEEILRRMKEKCEECGGKVEDIEMCLLGLDVTALFPSMSAKRTGEIIRRRIMRSRSLNGREDWLISK